MREAWPHTSLLHGGLLKYPIFRDISEIKRMRKQCIPGVLSPVPSECLGMRLVFMAASDAEIEELWNNILSIDDTLTQRDVHHQKGSQDQNKL